ncbi:NAD(P)/FAD-dependent oxidoreductase [Actinokineospora bangkokensis]|uniref:Amine oxidase n=1 Tax=Actinokineospora bangkokensis TaxID=1193682 RepID=A0A1Q9LPQ3_9PSEU|nr:FAD-dependent oxidoreductase [Actinokineospora bangkokensis]OLR93974.1 amine oxidase [Actinokineospora bangkokensis]
MGARQRVAVIGSGVSGLTAAYLLQRHHDVTLFEADDRLGGHAHTHDLATPDGGLTRVDSGFIVHNERTYPNLLRLFAELGVATRDSEMSMSVRCEGCGLEYAGARGPRGLFAQRANLANPRYLRMLAEVKKFHVHARRVLRDDPGETTLRGFAVIGGYSRYFVDHFLVPLVSAVWSSGAELSMRYPARYLFEFLQHHGMLSVTGSPQWKTVVGGSRTYVERAVKGLTAVEVSTPVRAVARHADHVEVRDDADVPHRFDKVVVATHPDQALRLLSDPTAAEREVLGAFEYSRNETLLHTDASIMPRALDARASWNYLKPACSVDSGAVQVSYHMNRLMGLSEPEDYVVTLNAPERVDPASVLRRMVYEHPVYTPESLAAQRRLPELTDHRVAYAGAYHGWGFHEDGCASGVRAAEALGSGWDAR